MGNYPYTLKELENRFSIEPSCGEQQSVTVGTIFQATHVPLATWFRAAWWGCPQKNGASALTLQQVFGIGSYRTAWMLLHACVKNEERKPVKHPKANVSIKYLNQNVKN